MKNYKFIVPIALIAVFLCSIYMKYDTNQEKHNIYEQNLKAALESRELGVWVDAEKFYLEALNYGESVDLRLEIAQLYVDFNLSGKAVEWGEETSSLYPREVDVYEFLMDTYIYYGDYSEAFAIYDKVKKLRLQSAKIEENINAIRYTYYSEGQYNDVGIYSGQYCAVQTNEKWGYTDMKGRKVITPQFVYAGPFAFGVAPIIDADGQAYYIDENGNKKIVVKNVEHIEMLGLIENDLFSLFDGEDWGFYNPKGEMIFGKYKEVSSIGNGVAAVKTDDKWMLVDSKGNELATDRYDSVIEDEKGVVCRNDRIFAEKLGYYYLIDSAGNPITDQKFENADVFNSSGYAAVELGGRWGFVDLEGNVVIEPQFEEAKSFSNGLAAVKKENQWGYIDESGSVVIPAQFENAGDFNNGGAAYVQEFGSWKLIVLYLYNH